MSSQQEEFYSLFGFYESLKSSLSPGAFAGRVIQEEKNLFFLQIATEKSVKAVLSGKLKLSPDQKPAVGDWVQYKLEAPFELAVIEKVLPRKGVLLRNRAGSKSESQALAANVDTVFLTASLNEDLNLNRLERYLAVSWDAGAQPVIVLTKSDLCSNLEEILFELEQRFIGVTTVAVTKEQPETYSQLQPFLTEGLTAVVLGSSGVGKSTLINHLIGREVLKTQSIREDDSKGRHTTTSRSIHISRYGGLVMDTPGMRELQLYDQEEGLSHQFQDIEDLMLECKFSNCQHQSEPQCAVKSALQDQTLSAERFQSYLKLQAELRFQLRKQNKALASEEKKKWKKINTDMYERLERRRK